MPPAALTSPGSGGPARSVVTPAPHTAAELSALAAGRAGDFFEEAEFIFIGSRSLVGYLYYLASHLPGLRPPWVQTRKVMRSWGRRVGGRGGQLGPGPHSVFVESGPSALDEGPLLTPRMGPVCDEDSQDAPAPPLPLPRTGRERGTRPAENVQSASPRNAY